MAGYFISEGDLVVERALRAGFELESMLVDAKRTKPLPETIADSVPLYACGPQVLQRITGYHLHRGMLACFRRRPLPSFDDVAQSAKTVAVMENINNPTNLGVILRCAAALGVDAFFVDPTCSDPLYRRCGRVSMGEAYSTPYTTLAPLPVGLRPLRKAGYRLIAMTPAPGAIALDEVKLAADEKVAILLGAEGPGLTDETIQACDLAVRIPMSGQVDSINVGSAAAVAFYGIAQARKRR